MNDLEASKILRENNIEIDLDDYASPSQIAERLGLIQETERSLGAAALVETTYVKIGVEGTGETDRDQRERLSKEGISSHPIGWGVVFYRRRHKPAN